MLEQEVNSIWLLITFLWYPSINLMYRLVSTLLYNVSQLQPGWLNNPLIILMPFIASIINGGLSEEVGWRGYALPRLQSRFNAVQSSLILGFMEGLWHVPLVFWAGDARYGMSIPLLIILQMISTFQRTWIYNNTGGNIFTAILFHAIGNTAGYVIPYNLPNIAWLPRTKFVTPFLIAINIMIIIALILIYGPETMTRKITVNTNPTKTSLIQ